MKRSSSKNVVRGTSRVANKRGKSRQGHPGGRAKNKSGVSNRSDDGEDMVSVEPPPLIENEIMRFNPSKKITSMIEPSFLSGQNYFGAFVPISESMNVTHGVSYADNANNRIAGPAFKPKDPKQMSKH